jgi:hypothetical protein
MFEFENAQTVYKLLYRVLGNISETKKDRNKLERPDDAG